ncbi:MAG TPA: S8 family serine peptidase [Anaerolineae bacterium]|nr:S8 family serine peptidase [Anaerolineae bacterium]
MAPSLTRSARLQIACCLAVALLFQATTALNAARPSTPAVALEVASAATGQIIVKFRRGTTLSRVASQLSSRTQGTLASIPHLGVVLLQVSPGAESATANELRRHSDIEWVELNLRAQTTAAPGELTVALPDDPMLSQQWPLSIIHAPEAWSITHSRDIIIAILDTGTYLNHPDLVNVLWTNPGEIPANGLDDDGNGCADDVHGWHYFTQCDTGVCVPSQNRLIGDDNGHGTHVAGTAAAETNNGTGIAGVSWGARLMTVKVLDQDGDGWYFDIAAGIVYAADNGAQIINLSLGGSSPSQLLQDAVDYAHAKGSLLVAASGNNGGAVYYPGACQNVLTVAATDTQDNRLPFSNQGPQVDIAAPGDYLISTWYLPSIPYRLAHGTSMAAPHVSGAAALLWTWRPDWTNDQIQQRLLQQADDVNSSLYPGFDPQIGWGRLNIQRALEGLEQGPTPIPTSSATPTRMPSPSPTATPAPALVSGLTWRDDNANCVRDPAEPPLAGVIIILTDANHQELARQATDSDGTYVFTNLPAANYVLTRKDPAGYANSCPLAGSYAFYLAAGEQLAHMDFGFAPWPTATPTASPSPTCTQTPTATPTSSPTLTPTSTVTPVLRLYIPEFLFALEN